ncbi:uronate dehydrogenase [Noviherbaspirillum humi]|uniref:Uronate dehydrogenase n=1 Tax=Noviherbaspirillum humi TaxID=1688639 RepID=A0A239C3H2_9BURK|nr:NAD(P)-dependent oxidoreductase [Noviherbaspirillum humi]SNS14680.1 uronate dehydrogenase [Noviherbaspirillum humi]
MLNRLLLTGAAGGLGKVMRRELAGFAKTLRVSDIQGLGSGAEHEEVFQCDLGDAAAVNELVQGVDAIVHLGGISVEDKFEPILNANIIGLFNLYQAARRHGVKRIVFASSNHVVGFYRQDEVLDTEVPMRPDTLYGVSKGFGELLSRMYFDRYGIETVCVRIGSCMPEPKDRRMLASYMSYADFTELMRCALFKPEVGHTVIYGMSANRDVWWDNSKAAHLGFTPKDSSEPFRAAIEQQPPVAEDDPLMIYQGGRFVVAGPFDN